MTLKQARAFLLALADADERVFKDPVAVGLTTLAKVRSICHSRCDKRKDFWVFWNLQEAAKGDSTRDALPFLSHNGLCICVPALSGKKEQSTAH